MGITGKEMAAKADTAYTNRWGYIWATAGVMWNTKKQAELEAKYNSDPKRYADLEQSVRYGKKWFGHKVADCSGLIKWAAAQVGLKGIYHGSNSQFNKNCRMVAKIEKGSNIPVGALIFTGKEVGQHNHVGILVNPTTVCEAKGTQNGVVHSPLSNKKWMYWGLLKGVEYDEVYDQICGEAAPVVTKPGYDQIGGEEAPVVVHPTLRRGAKGDEVRLLQTLLAKDGSSLAIDGIFGSGTMSAVRGFQNRHGLVVDGIVGPKTWAELVKLQ